MNILIKRGVEPDRVSFFHAGFRKAASPAETLGDAVEFLGFASLSMQALSWILLSWPVKKLQSSSNPDYGDAAAEPVLRDGKTCTVVYGHTHVYKLVPLDSKGVSGDRSDQIYINSGTWRPYHELGQRDPKAHRFTGYRVLTILGFFANGERRGRNYEVWNGVLDNQHNFRQAPRVTWNVPVRSPAINERGLQ
jgi:hypothetical protein